MSADNSTFASKPNKPAKPFADFPLFPHATGRWAKKIRGKMHYFGPWADPAGALAKYTEQKDDLHAGRSPRPAAGEVTVKDTCNAFLNHKATRRDAGELAPRTWAEYRDTCAVVLTCFGKGRLAADLAPEDFALLRDRLAQRLGPVGLGNNIQRVRCLFKYAFDAGLIASPVRFRPGFARPSKKVLRLHRAKQGARLFTAEELRRLLDHASPAMRAMVLLGINAGLGNTDVAGLPLSALDLDRGWLDYPRPKTGVGRRCSLWPETIAAIREYLAERSEPKGAAHAGLVFLSRIGTPLISNRASDRTDNLAWQLRQLMRALGINGRKGLGFYTLRHTFRTVADGAKDQPAADFIMGHESPHMSTHYREGIEDARLKAVSDHVRAWLYGAGEGQVKP